MFGRSAKELTNPVNLAKVGLLIAMSMVLEMYSINLQFVKINFAFLATAVIGMLFGPTVGFFAGLACDVVGFMVSPTGAFMPVYTLVAGFQGLIYGLCVYSRTNGQWMAAPEGKESAKEFKGLDITLFVRAVIARLLDVIVINLFINTSLNLHYGFIHADSFTAAIIARVAKNVIELAADIPLLFVLLPAALIAHRKTGGFKRKKTAEASGL